MISGKSNKSVTYNNFAKIKFYNNEDMAYSRLAEYTIFNELRYDTRRVTSKNRLQVIRSFYKRVLCVASWKNCDEILFYFFTHYETRKM